jgi:hypothetical protein
MKRWRDISIYKCVSYSILSILIWINNYFSYNYFFYILFGLTEISDKRGSTVIWERMKTWNFVQTKRILFNVKKVRNFIVWRGFESRSKSLAMKLSMSKFYLVPCQ